MFDTSDTILRSAPTELRIGCRPGSINISSPRDDTFSGKLAPYQDRRARSDRSSGGIFDIIALNLSSR